MPTEDEWQRLNDWNEYKRQVLSDIQRVGKEIENANDKLDAIRVIELAKVNSDIQLLKFQAWLMGAIGGVVVTVAISILPKLLK